MTAGRKILRCIAFFSHADSVSRTLIYDFSTIGAGLRPDIDDEIGSTHDVFVMLYHNDGVSDALETSKHSYKPACIAAVEPDTRFVKDI